MNFIKKICKKIIIMDYVMADAKKAQHLRCNIIKSQKMHKDNIIFKVTNKLKEKKYNKICYKNNAFIPLSTEFAEEGNICFPHGLCGIFISGGAKIGKNCTIFQQVTIGSNTLKDSKKNGAPTIGDNVYIGAGAKIIGDVVIGNNVRIGANAIVVKDVPDNATVIIDNIKVITHNKARDNKFESFSKDKNNKKR